MEIHVTKTEDQQFAKVLEDKIRTFNNDHSPLHKESREPGYIEYYNVRVRDNGFMAGMICKIYWNSMKIEDLYIEEKFRKTGLGKTLIKKAINHALELDLSFIWLQTYSFQAKDFYSKYGFKVIGEIKDYPPGESFYTMRLDMEKEKNNE